MSTEPLDTLLTLFADRDATIDNEVVSIPLGYLSALEVELVDDPLRPTQLELWYRRWAQDHGLDEEVWLCSWPLDSVGDGRLRRYIDGLIENFEREA